MSKEKSRNSLGERSTLFPVSLAVNNQCVDVETDPIVGLRGLGMSYWALVTTRNRCKNLSRTLESIFSQERPCARVIVFDDGSSDGTMDVLESYKHKCDSVIRLLHRPDLGYDIKRVVRNWNACLAEAQSEGLDRGLDFTLITADDCVYPSNYVRTIVERMNTDPLFVVASGTRGVPAPLDGWRPPEGSGRIIRNSFFSSVGFRFPEKSLSLIHI